MLTEDEAVTVSCLEGIVNAKSTRMVVLAGSTETWLKTYGFEYKSAGLANKYKQIASFMSEVSGAVLYSTEKSDEYINLACTVANVLGAVPMTKEVCDEWTGRGMSIAIKADLTELTYDNAYDIYNWLYRNYWAKCSHKLLLVQRPSIFNMRDLSSAIGGAVIHLSCAGGKETDLYRQFLSDMTPGESIVTGWYEDQERALMTVTGQCGLSVVPSDWFSNATVFGQDIPIEIKEAPVSPALENKIYVAFYFSDGDNIQYDMGAMREYWDNTSHGSVAVNWTISPALADVAPGMMNYYYENATDNDCFVCGPSGLGYCMPINTFGENVGNNFENDEYFTAYVRLTNRYLKRSGLKVVTVWDDLSDSQRDIYTKEADGLLGLTVQNFTNASLSLNMTGVVNGKLIQQMTPGYFAKNAEGTTPLSDIERDIKNAVEYQKYDGGKPVFVSAQGSVWAFHDVDEVAALEKDLSDYYAEIYGADVVEFVRADHYFELYSKANGPSA